MLNTDGTPQWVLSLWGAWRSARPRGQREGQNPRRRQCRAPHNGEV